MRTSLSCDSCRKSKLRCVHRGSPPCTRCEKSGIPDCQLTQPHTKGRLSKAKSRLKSQILGSTITTRCVDQTQPPSKNGDDGSAGANQEDQSPSTDSHLEALPICVILKSLNYFTQSFPELQMLHPVVFQGLFEPGQERTPDSKALLSALLAAVKKQECYSNTDFMGDLLSHQAYATYACKSLAKCMLQAPNVIIVQAHLVLAIYEWGVRDFQKAWLHCGIAIRLMQSLHSIRVAPFPLDEAPDERECDDLCQIVETSTFWACFILDCFISSGTYNPRMLSMCEMRKLGVPRPAPSTGFTFGFKQQTMPAEPQNLDSEHVFEILTNGFDIYADVMAWVYRDGRKASGMCAPEQCPWAEESCWAKCWRRLMEWRSHIDPRLLYPNNDVGLYASSGGLGRSFVYINLLYYHCIIMLHREYFPFLPKPNAVPRGPTDPPLLEADPPAGWWEESSRHLFQAAANVADLMHWASIWGLAIMTPVPAFCCFTACYLNQYAVHFPSMTMDNASRAEELLEAGLVYLGEFRKAWQLGDGWVKTIENAKLLFEQAASKTAYLNKSRSDFEILHQSAHEFRSLDRSAQHLATIRSAEFTRSPRNTIFQADGSDRSLPEPPGVSLGDIAIDRMFWPTWYSLVPDLDHATYSPFEIDIT